MGCCDKIKNCADVCDCIEYISSDGSVIINKLDCVVDLTTVSPAFSGSSSSLVITPGGVAGHSPNIELVPSTDAGNVVLLGTDGHPFVRNLNLAPGSCISYTITTVSGVKTFTPVIDFSCIAASVCGLCTPAVCPASTTLTVS